MVETQMLFSRDEVCRNPFLLFVKASKLILILTL